MHHNVSKYTLTRREFLKVSAAMAAVVAVTDTLRGKSPVTTFIETANAAGQEVTTYGNCAFCQQGDCQTVNKLVNGVVVKVEGDPGSPVSLGQICARGNSAIMNLYNAYRVKTPLKRTNPEKGIDIDPRWVEISWDEALNTVGAKLKAVKAKDPRGLVVNESFGSKETAVRTAFQLASGTPNMVGSHGPLCSVHYASNIVQGGGPVSTPDLTYTEYHITEGRCAGMNMAMPGAARRLTAALDRGMKFIDIDPRNSEDGSKGQWVPIRPGTELAFNLSMANVMMHEIGTIDEWFLKTRTNAPYLIDPNGDYVRDPASQKPMMYDVTAKMARPFDDPAMGDVALEGEFTVNDIVSHPGYQLIKDEFKQYTPEWQEPLTTIPAATVRTIATDFVSHAHIGSTIVIDGFTFPYRPVSFNNERGTADHKGGTYADLTTKIINMLVGAIEVPGGCLANCTRGAGPLTPDKDGTVTPTGEAAGVPWKFPPDHVDMSEFYPNKHTGPHLTVKAILNPDQYYLSYTIDVWLGAGGNSISSTASPETFIAAYKKVGFVATISYHFDAPTMMADIVLPEHSFMERVYASQPMRPHQNISDEFNGLKEIFVRNPIPALYNTMHCDDIYTELADRAGYLYGPGGVNDQLNKSNPLWKDTLALDLNKKYTAADYYDRKVKAFDPKLDLQTVMAKGNVHYFVSKKLGYNYYYWPDNKTRHPFYFMHLKEVSDKLKANLAKDNAKIPNRDNADFFQYWKPIPHYLPNTETNPKGDLNMFAVNWKFSFYANGVGAPHENVWLEDIVKNYGPYHSKIWLNTKTAANLGIKDGDTVYVENSWGKIQGTVLLTEMIHPEVVGIPGMRGTGTIMQNPIMAVGTGPHFNRLVPMDDNTFEPVNGSLEVSPRVKVYKA